jgi:hypothetical protein
MAEIENLGTRVFKQLMVEAGGNFTDTVGKKLHRRLPSFNERQLVDTIKTDQRAVDRILQDYYNELTAACGAPDGPAPDYAEISRLVSIFPEPNRTGVIPTLRNVFPWIVRGWDHAAYRAKMEVIKQAEQAFLTAVRDLDGHDLESFVLSLLEEHRRPDAHVSSLAIRLRPVCRALKLPEPVAGMYKTFAAVAAALAIEMRW